MNTPITNANEVHESTIPAERKGYYVPSDLARQLERDRARLLEALKQSQDVLLTMRFVNEEIMQARNINDFVLASLEIKDDK